MPVSPKTLLDLLGVELPIIQAPMAGVSIAGHGRRCRERRRVGLDRSWGHECGGRPVR